MSDLEAKRIVVTGASRGIGQAIALEYARRGATVIASARSETSLAETKAVFPDRIRTISADLLDEESLAGLARTVSEAFGEVDALVCCAGALRYGTLEELEASDFEWMMKLHVVAPAMLVRALLPALRAGFGSVLMIGSTLAQQTAPGMSAYAASKAALHSLTHSLALELAPEIRVNTLSLGVIETDMTRSLRPGFESEKEQLEVLRSLHPLKRLGTAEEAAEAAVFATEARWMTGSILTLDGGLVNAG